MRSGALLVPLVMVAAAVATAAPQMRGSEAAAVAAAVAEFKNIYAKPDLRHYSVRYVRQRDALEITFVPDLDRRGTIGGETDYGPEMTYLISLTTFKVLHYNFYK
jgi:hypothetical protein